MQKKIKNCVRTDLALEKFKDFEHVCDGVTKKIEEDGSINITTIEILNEEGVEALGREIGTYITIESEIMGESDREAHNKIISHLAGSIKKLLEKHEINEDDEVLVVGLGNRNFTPDTIGIDSLNKVLVTKHIYKNLNKAYPMVFRPLSAIGTGVMGQTGMETANIIKGVLKANTEVKMVIVIDALASRSIDRLNRTIQICDTGIAPGSGVNNKRKTLNEEFLGCKVLAIGVPTVIDLRTIIYDSFRDFFGEDHKIFEYNHIDDYLQDLENYFVSTKEIDEVAERLKNIIANGINIGVHNGLTLEDINDFML